MEFKDKVYFVRQKLGLTQFKLAKELNVDYVTVNKWEKGIHKPQAQKEYEFYTYCKKHNIVFDEFIVAHKEGKSIKEIIIKILNEFARSNETKARDVRLNGHFITDSFDGIFKHIAEARQSRQDKYFEYERWRHTGFNGDESMYKQYQTDLQIKDTVYYDKLERLYEYLIGEKKL